MMMMMTMMHRYGQPRVWVSRVAEAAASESTVCLLAARRRAAPRCLVHAHNHAQLEQHAISNGKHTMAASNSARSVDFLKIPRAEFGR